MMESVSKKSSENSVGRMFDRIASVYDKLNHILSFGLDFSWRAKLAGMLEKDKQLKILDLAVGTGDLLIAILKKNPNITEAAGLDISENMLEICREKIKKNNLSQKVNLICSDVLNNTLPDNTYDYVTMGFGIRNTPDSSQTLSEIFRLLKKNGSVLILEFSIPSNKLMKFLYMVYLRYWVPFIGRTISGDSQAYKYLNTSVEGFHNAKDFTSLMEKAGFQDIKVSPLTFGIVSIYKGTKTDN